MPLMLRVPPRESQDAFNLRRWEKVLADRQLAGMAQRIETDRHGHIVMTPPPGPIHGSRQFQIAKALDSLLAGKVITECPLSTSDGVKAVDVGWFSDSRFREAFDRRCFLRAPEICVEILSPSNTAPEMEEKMALYFEAGAEEVWFCEEDGTMRFHLDPESPPADQSRLCPDFPGSIPE